MLKKVKNLMASTLIFTLILSVFNIYAADSDFWHSSIGAKEVLYNEVGFNNLNIDIIKEDNSLWRWGYKVYESDDGVNVEPDFKVPPKKFFDNVKDSGNSYVLENNGDFWIDDEKMLDDVREAGSDYAIKNDDSLWIYSRSYRDNHSMVKIMDNVRTAGSSYAIKNDGTLWVWGTNYYGELGTGNTENVSNPIKILDNVKEACICEKEISDGFYTYGIYESGYYPRAGYAITSDNSLWVWGTIEEDLKPFKVLDNVKEVSIFFAGFYALQENNDLWYIDYALNTEFKYPIAPAYRVTIKQEMSDVKTAYTRGIDFYVLKNDNTLWKLEDGTLWKFDIDYDNPKSYHNQNLNRTNEFKQIMTNVKEANSFGHALKTNGDLYINLGDEGYREEPLKNIKSFGRSHAIEEDGSLWLWDLLGTKEPVLVLKPIAK